MFASFYRFLTMTGCLAMCASNNRIPPQLLYLNANTLEPSHHHPHHHHHIVSVPSVGLQPPVNFGKPQPGFRIPISGAQIIEPVPYHYSKPRQMEVNYPQRITFTYDSDIVKKIFNPPQSADIREVKKMKNSVANDNKLGTENDPEFTTEDYYSTSDYTTETANEYSTTPLAFNDGLELRGGVSDSVAASLLG